jgi:hypothetical protein
MRVRTFRPSRARPDASEAGWRREAGYVGAAGLGEVRWGVGPPRCAVLTLCSVSTASARRRQVPGPASPVTRPGVRIERAETIDPRHGREALLDRGVAAVDPAMAGAVIRAPTAVSTSTRGDRRVTG